MTVATRLTALPNLHNWLSNTVRRNVARRYHHRELKENLSSRNNILPELQTLIHAAHEDMRQHFRDGFDIPQSLDPLEQGLSPGVIGNSQRTQELIDLINSFPGSLLEVTTLKGYFGEIFSAVIAENLAPLDDNWVVPAFPFKCHQNAYHALGRIDQGGPVDQIFFDRIGDDMVAFKRDANGNITRILFCEAKCTANHNRELIKEAHQKMAGEDNLIPVSAMELSEIFKTREDHNSDAADWRRAIINLILTGEPEHERCDLICYILGLPPVRESTEIIPRNVPHELYTVNRQLEAVEIHLHDAEGLIEQVYKRIDYPLQCSFDEDSLQSLWVKIVSFIPTKHQEILLNRCCLRHSAG